MKVSLKDVKVELKTHLFEVNIQMFLEGLMFIIKCQTWFIESFNWLFVRLERMIKCSNGFLKAYMNV